MKLVDANVLLCAVNAVHHEVARAWLNSALSGGGQRRVCLCAGCSLETGRVGTAARSSQVR